MLIRPTREANGSIFDIHDDAVDIMLYPLNDEVPCPWDADIIVEEGRVVLLGGLSAGGYRGGSCRCECSIEEFTRYYKLAIPNDNDDLLNALEEAGWKRA